MSIKREVNEHFRHEEEQVFPHLEALQKGNSDNSYRIRTFVPEHSNIEDITKRSYPNHL
jgi:iron-sulfur cluster repair protein YtfE (RIC family)